MYRNLIKRMVDVALALIALPFWTIILITLGLIIYLQDKGPIFYNAPRLGKNGKVFKMYKFRSMKVNALDIRNEDGSTFNSENDLRLTRIGKFIRKTSLDETPQILNILKGDMSFIGPRPDLPEQYPLYKGNEHRKLEIRPGITGFSQAYYRNTITWKERIQHDIYYIDHLSWWLDLKIFLKTISSVVKREGVYAIHTNTESRVRLESDRNTGMWM